jgi:hypothetical protein
MLPSGRCLASLRDAHRVVAFAEAAQGGPWHLPVKVRADVIQQAALGLAMIGEPLSKVERIMDEARASLAQAERDDDRHELAGINFTADTLLLRQAACYTEAGKPARAAALFGAVIARGGLSRRDAGFFRARQATALALSGEPDEAAAVGLQAIQAARETNSERTIRVLADVAGTLTPWSSRPGPQALSQALSASRR